MTGLVVVNYNDYKNTIEFINSVSNLKCIEHIVIVDNCSTDNSVAKLKKICNKKITLISNVSNKGYGSGINLGAKYLIDNFKVKNIVVSNTDIIINNENDVEKLLSYMEEDIGIVAPVISEKGNINRGWKIPSVINDCLLNLPIIHRKLRKKLLFYKESNYNDEVTEVEVVSGCFFVISADALEKVNYYDENIFLYYEENVMAVKLKQKKYRTLVINNVVVIHNHSVTIDNSLNRIRKYKELKKSQKYFHKNYSKESILGRIMLNVTDKFMLMLLHINTFIKRKK